MTTEGNETFTMSQADTTYARWLFAQPATFVAGADQTNRLPSPSLPEVAFVGRSNVGKSTLINALTHRKQLARVSHTPGRTQQINFFTLGKALMLVDLPGYGYANVSHKKQQGWRYLMRGYFEGRTILRCVMVLLDSRHPLKETDCDAMDYFNSQSVPFQVIMTKIDQIPAQICDEHRTIITQFIANLPMAHRAIIPVSARRGDGIDVLRGRIAMLCASQNYASHHEDTI